jgi:OmcA/MtrC family decaheme c-type cytochrome
MESGMKQFLLRCSTAACAALLLALSGCGGGGGGDATPPPGGGGGGTPPPPTINVAQVLASASAVAANDATVNSTSAFAVLQGAGVSPVTVNSAPKVNFAVFADGKIKTGLALSNVGVNIAKFVPGTNGAPDQWVNYVYRTATANQPNPALASALQATNDPKSTDAAGIAAQLVYNADGYYTYTFNADIKNPQWTGKFGTTNYSVNGVAFEPNRTHRVALQLNYVNAAGQTVRVNPYFDFTIDASGNAVPATTANAARKMVDISSCNNCHDKLAAHGGNRVDTQYCVMCHNPGSTDPNSGNVVTLSNFIHSIHDGAGLAEQGKIYSVSGSNFSDVKFPQPIRNCTVCHSGSNPKTPQGDNWKNVPSKQACLSCHVTGAGTAWDTTHVTTLKLGASAAAVSDSTCSTCHGATSPLSADKVHWVQELANTANYQTNIEKVTVTKAATASAAGTMAVTYSVTNPATGAAYDLREGCAAAATTDSAGASIVGCNSNYRWDAVSPPTLPGKPTDKFGMFTVYLGAETLANVTLDDVTATASYAAYRGVDNGSHHYTANVAIPAGAKGNARVMIIGAVSERRLDPVTRAPVGAVPPTQNADLAYVPVKAPIVDVNVATGANSTTPRRQIVSNDNCNSCHAYLGLPMGADTVAFHKGHRNNADGCAICHNANQESSSTLMADGSTGPVAGDNDFAAGNTSSFLHESWQAKRFVHGIHYGEVRSYPFTHCMNVGGEYTKQADGSYKNAAGVTMGSATCVGVAGEFATDNFTAEVAYPGNVNACENCHVNGSFKQDRSVVGTVVFKPAGKTSLLDWQVFSPKVATCTTCHDSKAVVTHVTSVGGAYGTATQGDLLLGGKVFESCEGCHAPGSSIGIDTVHGKK